MINTVSGATRLRDRPEGARPTNVTLCGGFTEFVPLGGAPPMPLWPVCPSTGAHPLAVRFMERGTVALRQAS
ncbi:hypothetical protein [Streptomyces sp. NPDC046939]|uniref:hypothetical protein n=1 Tax=Streptomyces sp. NPDC046939 TaxID=3155376 RepID=UPI00340E3920